MNLKDVKAIKIPVPKLEGYTRLEYIQGTGTQYINTGFYPKPTTCIELDMQFNDLTVQQGLFGTGGSLAYQCYINGGGMIAYAYNDTTGNWISTGIAANTNRRIYTLDGKNKWFKLDNSGITMLEGSATNTANNTLTIFWRNGQSSAGSGVCKAKLFSCKIYDNGTLVRNYIPVKNSNNISGVYDLVNNTFTTSAVDNFEAGNELNDINVNKIEDNNNNIIWGSSDAYPYRQLECLNMKNAYIVTDFAPKQGFYYADCKFPSTFTGQWGMIYGAEGWANNAATRWWPGAMQSNNSGRLFQRIKAQGDAAIANLSALNTSHLYQVGARTYFTNNTSGRYWIHLRDKSNNMNYIYSQYYNSTILSMNLSTFNTIGINVATRKNASGNFLAQSGYADFSLYQFYIKSNADSDPVYFDAYPVQRKSDGVCGLYDIYGSKFYPCSGTASSTCAGPIVSEYWDPASLL